MESHTIIQYSKYKTNTKTIACIAKKEQNPKKEIIRYEKPFAVL
jgi:hypothetical protein